MPQERAAPPREIDRLSDELADRWLPSLKEKNWRDRLALVAEIHEQLKEDLADIELYTSLSPVLVRKIINGLPQDPITDDAQAQIYANSDFETHRQLALEWLRSANRS